MNTDTALRDRIAAALFRGDAKYASGLIELHNEEMEQEIRAKVFSEIRNKVDEEMEMTRQATVYFQTKDGLMVPCNLKINGEWPPVFRRSIEVNCLSFDSGVEKNKPETRVYELTRHRADNGSPIYRECDDKYGN